MVGGLCRQEILPREGVPSQKLKVSGLFRPSREGSYSSLVEQDSSLSQKRCRGVVLYGLCKDCIRFSAKLVDCFELYIQVLLFFLPPAARREPFFPSHASLLANYLSPDLSPT